MTDFLCVGRKREKDVSASVEWEVKQWLSVVQTILSIRQRTLFI